MFVAIVTNIPATMSDVGSEDLEDEGPNLGVS